MKIAILIPSLNTGGAERTAVALANWLSTNTDVEVHLINLGKNDNNYNINEKVNFYNKPKGNGILKKVVCFFDVIKYMNKVKPDVLFEMLFHPLKYALIYKIFHWKSVIIGSERANPKGYKTMKLKFLCRICPVLCNGYIFQTEKVQNMFPKYIRKKSIVIPNAISNPDVYSFKKSENKQKRLINVGRLNSHKGQDILIKAFAKVVKLCPEYELFIYGEGELREELQSLIEKLGLEKKVFLPGAVNNVINEVSKSEIFVMSSRYEGMPNALLEALAIGMPCISTNCTDLVIHEKNGLVVEIDDIDQMANTIVRMLNNKGLQETLSKEAKKVMHQHSTDNIYTRYYDFFKKVYKN